MTPVLQALRLSGASRALGLQWSDGTRGSVPYRVLRERCRCAECRSAMQKGLPIEAGDGVTVTEALPCGAGAVQLVFSDGHGRGIFPFTYLHELAASQST